MEKKRAEREKQKLEKEAKKKQQGNVSDAGCKPSKPEEEEDIIGNLMKEIRRGKSLKRRSEARSGGGSRPSRSGADLTQDDISRLQKIYEQSITEPIVEELEDVASANEPKVDVNINGHVNGNSEEAIAAKTVTAGNQLLAVNYRRDRVKSEVFADIQDSRKDQTRHSFHYVPHYETTV